MLVELSRHGYSLSPGTLYPMLREMEAADYLARDDRVVGGKVRKYYTVTAFGREALDEVRVKLGELAGALLDGETPTLPHSVHDVNEEDPLA